MTCAGNDNSILTPIAKILKILTNSNHLPGNGAKTLGARIALEQTPQHLIVNPRVS